MSKFNDGGSAFPQPDTMDEGSTIHHSECGMSLRDYFASAAMQGVIAASGDSDGCVDYSDKKVAKLSYQMADAMIEEREL